ncbi:MAG: bifunctional riboflavin kinase/FAD synthetase [Deltaproteobacteria bacterium]
MQVVQDIENVPNTIKGAIATIGNFDGVHLGHQAIFERMKADAKRDNAPIVAITFEPHPKRVISPDKNPFYLITTLNEKIALMESCGLDGAIVIPFNKEFANIDAETFVTDTLCQKLKIKKLFVGHDYTFGKNKTGNETLLKRFVNEGRFALETISAYKFDNTIISSTVIRNCILAGDVKQAGKFLGRHYNISGSVIAGYGRGAKMGFPTANIQPNKTLLPAIGVYAVIVNIGQLSLMGALNIGFNPTFDNDKLSVEIFLLNYDGDIYGETMEIMFAERVRSEIAFTSSQELIEQIKKDVVCVKNILQPLMIK